MTSFNSQTPPSFPLRERGSALIISTLVMVILTLLGISYLTLEDTESLIALKMTYQ
jgi:Tfp pilus assembly protein PilX